MWLPSQNVLLHELNIVVWKNSNWGGSLILFLKPLCSQHLKALGLPHSKSFQQLLIWYCFITQFCIHSHKRMRIFIILWMKSIKKSCCEILLYHFMINEVRGMQRRKALLSTGITLESLICIHLISQCLSHIGRLQNLVKGQLCKYPFSPNFPLHPISEAKSGRAEGSQGLTSSTGRVNWNGKPGNDTDFFSSAGTKPVPKEMPTTQKPKGLFTFLFSF